MTESMPLQVDPLAERLVTEAHRTRERPLVCVNPTVHLTEDQASFLKTQRETATGPLGREVTTPSDFIRSMFKNAW